MLVTTKDMHERLDTLGHALGFEVTTEVSDSVLRLRLDEAYRPRVDLLWSLRLSNPMREAIAWALGRDLASVTHLPVVGIEVEGTTPTTKTMTADVANLAALGVPLGLLVVSEVGEKNIYRRAVRAIRSIRRSFGDLHILALEAGWLEQLTQRTWPSGCAPAPVVKLRAPAGGETLVWSRATRDRLRSVGQAAGFVVAEPYVPSILASSYELIRRQRATPLRHTCDPLKGTVHAMRKAADLFTESQIDLAWLMPLPAALRAFLEAVLALDPCLAEDGAVFPELWSHIPVVAFELESGSGKHAGGGLLNLSAYGVLGIAVAPSDRVAGELQAVLRTYQPTMGLRNVYVRTVAQ